MPIPRNLLQTNVASLPEALAEVDQVLAGLTASSRDQVDMLGHAELGPVLVALRQVEARCDALILATIGEVDDRGTFTLDGALTTGAWVLAAIHPTPESPPGCPAPRVPYGQATLPNTVAALAAGAFGASHAAIITDGVTDAPAEAVALIKADIVDLASQTDENGTANLMRAFGHALDPDAADEKASKRHDRAGITAGQRRHPHRSPATPGRCGRHLPPRGQHGRRQGRGRGSGREHRRNHGS